jgi:CBS domain-containing protein
VATAGEEELVVDAARRMSDLRVGDLIVVVGQPEGQPRPVGIVTDRDLVVQVLARPERNSAETRVGEVMQREVVVAAEEDEVESVIEKMRAHAIRRIPIVDRDGGLQGILSLDDMLGWMCDQIQSAAELVERQCRGPLDLHPR